MKHLTLLFCKVLSGVCQQGFITANRKNMLLKAWQEAMASLDKKMLRNLLYELSSININKVWKAELNSALEELN